MKFPVVPGSEVTLVIMTVQHLWISNFLTFRFDGLGLERLDISCLGRIVSTLHKSWAVSGEVFESRCVPVGRRHFLRLHLSASYAPHLEIRAEDIHVQSSTKECVFSLEQPRESDSRAFLIRFLVSRVGPFSLGVLIRGQHISGSPFLVKPPFTSYE